MAVQTAQGVPTQEAGVPQPQTTEQPAGGPFIRYANEGTFREYEVFGQPFGAVIQNPLNALPGYLRAFRLALRATGGANSSSTPVTVAAAADAPYNVIQQISLKDPFGTVLVSMGGYELKLWQKYGAQWYLWNYADPSSLPSFEPISVGSTGTGDFYAKLAVPLEFTKGYGTISMANGSLMPQLLINANGSGNVYTTAPPTLPTIDLRCDANIYWLPQQDVAPPGLGSTIQAVLQVANPTIGSGSNQLVTFPRLGGYIDVFILIMRDSQNNRIDAWPNRLKFWVDGIPLIDIDTSDLEDDMANHYQFNPAVAGAGRETGVLVISRQTSLGQVVFGLLDTLETTLSTNPGTLLAVEGSPWGTIANAPATLNLVAGQIVPSGRLLYGEPEI